MPSGTYLIADVGVRIESIYDEVQQMCRDYATSQEPDVCIATTPAHIEREREESRQQRIVEGLPPYEFPDSYLETLAVYRQIADYMLQHDTLLFHGSAIAVDGQCFLFTAKSGTGKSTHTHLWRQMLGDKAVMVNDDKPLIQISSSKPQPIIYGTPWDGKHHLSSNTSVPLKAICILTRSLDNHIERITPADAADMLFQQSYHPDDALLIMQYLELINQLAQKTELYLLGCNMDPEAARVAYEGMK